MVPVEMEALQMDPDALLDILSEPDDEDDEASLMEDIEDMQDDFLSDNEENEQELVFNEDSEARFYQCHVCGDNWLSVKEVQDNGQSRLVFIHQMGIKPILKRVGNLSTHIVINDNTIMDWSYFMDENQIEETEWRNHLDKRRKVLKAICAN